MAELDSRFRKMLSDERVGPRVLVGGCLWVRLMVSVLRVTKVR